MATTAADLTLYIRQGCHLCDQALAVVRACASRAHRRVKVVDVDADLDVQRRFGLRVPVLVDGERELCWGRFDAVTCAVVLGVADHGKRPWWRFWRM